MGTQKATIRLLAVASVFSYVNGALAVALLTRSLPLDISLIIFAAFKWIAAILSTLAAAFQNKISYLHLLQLQPFLSIASVIVGIYWIDSVTYNIDGYTATSLSIRQLRVALITFFIASAVIDSITLAASWQLTSEPKQIRDISSDLTIKSGFDPESLTSSSKSSYYQKTVRIKNSLQSLIPSLAEKVDLGKLMNASKRHSATNGETDTADNEEDLEVEEMEAQRDGVLPSEEIHDIMTNPPTEIVLLPESQFSDDEDQDQFVPAFQFPDPITEEDDEFRPVEPVSAYMSPLHSPTKSTFSEASFYDYANGIENLDNLSDIPEHSADIWPLFSTGAGLTSTVDGDDGVKNHQMNHVSLDSWNNNSEHWMKRRTRGTPQDLPGRVLFSEPIESSFEMKKEQVRSSSGPASVNSEAMCNEDYKSNIMHRQQGSIITKHSQDQLEDQYMTIYGPGEMCFEDEEHLNSIVSQSFLESYESLTNMSPQSSPGSRMHSRGRSLNCSFGKLTPGIVPPLQNPTLRHRCSLSVISATTPISKRGGRSPSNSPLKKLKSFRFASSGLRNDHNPRQHCLHSRSEPELSFEFLNSLQCSPKRNSGASSFKGHKKARSSITSRSSLQRHKLEKRNHSQLKMIERGGEAELVVQGASDTSYSSADERVVEASRKSSSNSIPSAVIGQYDKEKWRVIQRNQTELAS
ncbi:DEKNAAC101263 [Brettanomyces naardenensis]|uniref:DEKNAAC101263 n=1 Tax=Brettanomyces naardenensis TaxID=13370 RepID=A0A448YHZ3_BRENA|nr:DEKNAAC101263 [Brettanomyces naardenensis]